MNATTDLNTLKPVKDGHRYYPAPCTKCGREHNAQYQGCDRCAAEAHSAERTTGNYEGPSGRFWRIVLPSDPTRYLGYGSTREACEWYLRSPDVPEGAVVEPAPRLTTGEARFRDLADLGPQLTAAEYRDREESARAIRGDWTVM